MYAVGLSISRNLVPFNLTPAELELVKAGISDGLSNKKPKVDPETATQKMHELLRTRVAKTAEAEKRSAQVFLEKAATEKGAEVKPSALIYTELTAGDGRQPQPTDKVKVNYVGKLRDGSVFDTSEQRGHPAEFAVRGVIPCWTEGLQLKKEHSKAKFVCPSELAYGDKGAPPAIKPGALLVFEVELLEVLPGSGGGQKAPSATDPGTEQIQKHE